MDEPSVMATENALMAAALTPGATVIGNAACEPHVQDLARMLVKMGADIQGIGSNLLTVNGAERLHGCEHEAAPDHIEIGSFMALAGVTGGELRIKDTVPNDLRIIRLVFERLGLRSQLEGNDVAVPGGQRLVVQSDVGDYKGKIQDGPWPAFPADLTSIAVALATQAEGSILVHEWMFENRLIFTDKLILMGADIVMCDPHRAIVTGPRRLRGERVESPTSAPAWRCCSPPCARRDARKSATSVRSTAATSASTSACASWGRTSARRHRTGAARVTRPHRVRRRRWIGCMDSVSAAPPFTLLQP